MKKSASPIKSAVEEVDSLRRLFCATLKSYGASVEVELNRLRETIAAKESADEKTQIASGLIHDARDIVTLMRTLEIKAEKGRRRDLKKIEAVIEDSQKIVAKW